MIYALVADSEFLDYSLAVERLSPEERQYVERKKTPGGRKESLAARLALSALYERVIKKEPPCLRADEYGKPYYEQKEGYPCVDISISHSSGVALVGIAVRCDLCVGVDIEKQSELPDEEHKQRIKNRLKLGEPTYKNAGGDSDISVSFARFRADGALEGECQAIPAETERNEKTDFSFLWCSAEAILKAGGKGFGGVCRLAKTALRAEVLAFELDVGKEKYTLAVATLPKETE